MTNKPIKAYSLDELHKLMKDLGQPSFRAGQLIQWLYLHHVSDYKEMSNLPAHLQSALADQFPLTSSIIDERHISQDGTRKYLIRLYDGILIETVAIPSRDKSRLTVCFSTQAGCPMGCSFCATGKEGLSRNLLPGEIVDQVLIVQEDMGMRVSNLVGMGQGEPFLNYRNVLSALHILNDPKSLQIGARRISISTCGVIPGILQFSNEPEQFTLAVSLHAARQELRDELMPKVSQYPLHDLKKSLIKYIEKTNRRITLEYLMIKGRNDTSEDLNALKLFCEGLLCHINLIPLNEIDGSPLHPSAQKTIHYWIESLHKSGIETTMRDSRGSDIAGACGQLKNTRFNL